MRFTKILALGVFGTLHGYSQVLPAFQATYEANRSLGTPRPQQTTLGAYQAWHEKAIVIWIKRAEAFYLLNTDTVRWYRIADPHANDMPESFAAFYDDKQLREMFKPLPAARQPETWTFPANVYPPWAGVAHLWLSNGRRNIPSWIDAMGWRKSHCGLDPALVFFQEFTNGVVIGPLRVDTKDNANGLIYTLVHDQPWKSSPVNPLQISVCGVPWTSPGGSTTVN